MEPAPCRHQLLAGLVLEDLHQLRHSAATHLGDKGVPLQLIMSKTRHRNPRTVMRYVKPGGEAVAQVTELLDITPARQG